MASVDVVIACFTVFGSALLAFQSCRPGFLTGVTEYDDGVYLGDAVRLVHGVVPYRDFVSVQPPGIVVLMAPVALVSRLIGTDGALAVARVLTACVGAVNIALLGRLVRHRGVWVTGVACGLLAVYPDSVLAAHTLLLEPWLALWCLIGAIAVFEGDGLRGSWRGRLGPWSGGLAFGFAGAVKVWAIVPVVVLLALMASRARRALRFAAGVSVGFLVVVLPFALGAPRAFVESVVMAQLERSDVRLPLWQRLQSLTGLTDVGHLDAARVDGIALVLAALPAGIYLSTLRRRPLDSLERYAVVGTALTALMFLWPADFYDHYTGFMAPFVALTVALAVGRLCPRSWQGRGAVALALSVAAVMAFHVIGRIGSETTSASTRAYDAVIPRGACVLTDDASFTVTADRFVSQQPGCSSMVDAIGTDYGLSGGRNALTGAGRSPAVRAAWLRAFHHARFVWLSGLSYRRVPWTPALSAYFRTHFRPIHAPGVTDLWRRD